MWARNLLFLGLCLAGLTALGATLFRAEPVSSPRQHKAAKQDEAFRTTVTRVDEAFRNEWKSLNLQPAPRASDLMIARRVSLALSGTVPSLEEIRQFETRPDETRIAWWVDGVLADRRSADYLAERLARPMVGVENGPFLLYRRRRFISWLADQLHENRRYDRIVRDVIAGTGLWTDHPQTNFITVSLMETDQGQQPDVNKLAGRVTRVFLGIRLDCAQCHDHPFEDRWKQRDFQSLAAFFAQAEVKLTGIRDTGGPYEAEDHATGERSEIPPAVPFHADNLPDQGSHRRRLATWITHPDNQYFARATVNRVWTLLCGRPLVEPVDDLPIDGEFPPAMEILSEEFIRSGFDLRRLVRLIAAAEVFQLDSAAVDESPEHAITEEHDLTWAAFPITRLRPEQVVGGLLQSASLTTIDYNSHIVIRLARTIGQNEFVERYGDMGEAELDPHGGTIPQRLLMLNGNLVNEKTKDNLVSNASTRIASFAPDDKTAVETAYLAVLTRRPTAKEAEHFAARLQGTKSTRRARAMADLYWTLINCTEFSWNH